MWKLSVEDDQGNKTVVNLVRDEYTVGRGEENTVRLTERNISRRHAAVRRNGVGWVIEDLSSYNGCFVNGVRVSESQPLQNGDLVQLGDYRLVVSDDAAEGITAPGAAETVPAVPRTHALLSQPDRLVMIVGPTPGAEFPLTEPRMAVGRGEECHISVNHGSVSRVHAEIISLGDGRYEIVDKESANGVRINGVELKQSLIDARDTIELGDVQLKFIPQGVVYAVGADESLRMDAYYGPATGTPPPYGSAASGLPAIVKIGAAVAGLGLLVILGMLLFGGGSSSRGDVTASASADQARRVLDEATALLTKGDFEGAHAHVATLPEDSNLRRSAEFRDIEGQWADSVFKAAEAAGDPADKRRLLDRVAKTTTVDDGRRKLAADKIASLEGGAVDPSELERAPGVPIVDKGALKEGIVRKNPFGDDPPAPGMAPAPAAPKVGAPKAAAPGAHPGGPTASDLATSGDRANALRAKAMYEAKANSGRATLQDLRVLRGLCGQLGDAACRARASALIQQKQAAGGN